MSLYSQKKRTYVLYWFLLLPRQLFCYFHPIADVILYLILLYIMSVREQWWIIKEWVEHWYFLLAYFSWMFKIRIWFNLSNRLNGIMRANEFQQSINNINQTTSWRKPLIICGFIFVLCIVGGTTATNSGIYEFSMPCSIRFGDHMFPELVMEVIGVIKELYSFTR
jgi:hypothetical protein